MAGKPIILLVDAQKEESRYIEKILGKKYCVHIEEDCGGAWDFLRKESPELILLNGDMGEGGCIPTLQGWKSDPKYADIPVILLLDSGQGADGARGLRAGAADLIIKPVPDAVVQLRVDKTLELAGLHRRVEHKEEQMDQISLQ